MDGLSLTLNLFWHLSVKTFFPPHHNNCLIYSFKCSCGLRYIGKTNQRLDARIKQHVSTKIRNFNVGQIDNLKNIYGSLGQNILLKNGDLTEKFKVCLFSILSKSHSSFHLKVLQTNYILSNRLPLGK